MSFLKSLIVLSMSFAVLSAKAFDQENFVSMSAKFAEGSKPTAEQLLKVGAWTYAGVLSNPNLQINHGYSDRFDVKNGVKNADSSQMLLRFRNDGPKEMFPFLAADRINAFTSNSSELYIKVNDDADAVSFSYGLNSERTYYTNTCRWSMQGEQLLICEVVWHFENSPNPIYHSAPYQQAKGQALVIQVFRQ